MDDLAAQANVPRIMLSGADYRKLIDEAESSGSTEEVITSEACRALIRIFLTLVNASPYRDFDDPTYDEWTIIGVPGEHPHVQFRVAHDHYVFTRKGSGSMQTVERGHIRDKHHSKGDEYYCSETIWELTESGSEENSSVTQITFIVRGSTERNAIYKTLSEAATFITDGLESPLSMVKAGRQSIEMSTVAGVDFCPNKTTATEVLSLHLRELLEPDSWINPDGEKIIIENSPLVVLDMDGTVTRKDHLHGNTVSNNLAKSAAAHGIKQCLRQGVVAVNSGNHALLQIWRLIAAFGTDSEDMNLLRRLVLVAQGGTVAYVFECKDDTVVARRLSKWDDWNRSLPEDRLVLQPVVVPLYVDDEVGGNESTFAGQLPVSVAGDTHTPGKDIAQAPKGQDEGLALALDSFLYINSLADNGRFNQVSTLTLEMMLRDKEAQRQKESAQEEEGALKRRVTMGSIPGMGASKKIPAMQSRTPSARHTFVRIFKPGTLTRGNSSMTTWSEDP